MVRVRFPSPAPHAKAQADGVIAAPRPIPLRDPSAVRAINMLLAMIGCRIGARRQRYDHQQERGYDFWIMRDPWGNEFCVLQPELPDLLTARRPWPDQ